MSRGREPSYLLHVEPGPVTADAAWETHLVPSGNRPNTSSVQIPSLSTVGVNRRPRAPEFRVRNVPDVSRRGNLSEALFVSVPVSHGHVTRVRAGRMLLEVFRSGVGETDAAQN
ncbi:hypothetical protein CBL_00666 [Carabus blaptoides fortunei]